MELAQKKCSACEGTETPFARGEAEAMLQEVRNWQLAEDAKRITKSFTFKNFADALAFVNKVGVIAEEEGHHPDVDLSWGKVVISLTTHAIRGLSENDFILAAKIDALA